MSVLQACPPGTTADTNEVLENACPSDPPELKVTITYEVNSGAPSFNVPEMTATVTEAETCADKPCPVIFDDNYIASDLDGVEYSVFPAQQYSSRFSFDDKSDLKTLKMNEVVSQSTSIDLVIEVK